MKSNALPLAFALLCFLFSSLSISAQESEEAALVINEEGEELSAEEIAYIEEMNTFWEGVDRQTGEITLPGNFATLKVPETFYYLNPKNTETILVDVWGNPPGTQTLGMLMPEKYTPFDAEGWAVTIEYVADGYVSDDDAADINYDKMLKQMIKETKAGSVEREQAGYGTMELLGWAEPPFYSHSGKHLYWGKDLLFDGETRVLNYDIRTLGREGVLSMTFIADSSQLAEVNDAREEVINMAAFNEGYRYEDFEPGKDKVAAYGISALVAGVVAKKAGLFVVALVFLKKFGIFILLGFSAFFGKIKSFFSKKPEVKD